MAAGCFPQALGKQPPSRQKDVSSINIILTIPAGVMIMPSDMATPRSKSAAPPEIPPAITWRRIEELQWEPKSTRSCSRKQIGQVAKSIAVFGFNVPILVGPGLRIIAGYVRLLAARQLGWSEVPTIPLHHLSAAQAHAFITADGRLAETGSWNDLLLAMRLKELSLAEPDVDNHAAVLPDGVATPAAGHRNSIRPPPRRRKGEPHVFS